MPSDAAPQRFVIGRVLRPHGVRGELRLDVMTSHADHVAPGQVVLVGPKPDDDKTAKPYTVVRARKHQHYLILQFETVEDRTSAEAFRQMYVTALPEDVAPLEEGEYYLRQLIGVNVYTDADEHLGAIVDVIVTGANDVYVVQGARGEVLLPAIDECVLQLDLDARTLRVHLMDGLLGD